MCAASTFLLKIRHGCGTERLADGRITVRGGFNYPLIIDAADLTLKELLVAFGKFPRMHTETYMPRYYDSIEKTFIDVKDDESLALMLGKHLGMKTVLMSVHIVNKETGAEHVINDFSPSTAQTTQPTLSPSTSQPTAQTLSQLNIQSDVEPSQQEKDDIEVGAEDDFPESDDDDEQQYPDVATDPDRLVTREYLASLNPNYGPDYGTDEEEEEENLDMGRNDDGEDEDRPVIHFDKENPTLDEGTIFECVEDCRFALATVAIRSGFDYCIEKSEPNRLRVYCRDTNMCKWRMHASVMKGGHPFQVAILHSLLCCHIFCPFNVVVSYIFCPIQIKVNTGKHTCPTTELCVKVRPASTKWIAASILHWLRGNQSLGPAELRGKLRDKFGIVIPYHRVFEGKEMALDMIPSAKRSTSEGKGRRYHRPSVQCHTRAESSAEM